MSILIKNALLVNDGIQSIKSVLIEGKYIAGIFDETDILPVADSVIDANGLWLMPGIIDDQVHFREPGLTHKADIYSESRAAAAGGVTSFMDMPNTNPSATTTALLNQKFDIAAKSSLINYSFLLGATNDNIDEIRSLDKSGVAGVKMFLGSSTGNLLVDKKEVIENILSISPVIAAAHCEDDFIISENLAKFKTIYGDDIPARCHPEIRSEQACFSSSSEAVAIAKKTGGKLHVFHLSTEKELSLFTNQALKEKRITAEVCVHHLWFNDTYYDKLGNKLKWNPAVKKESDRLALIQALKDGKVDIVATDHAPHTEEEKSQVYTKAPSGGPMIQHSLLVMLELASQGYFKPEDVVKWMCHNPAELFEIDSRGFVREGFYADLVLVDPYLKTNVTKDSLLYKCKWSPLEGTVFSCSVNRTFVNGEIVYENGRIIDTDAAEKLKFNR
jgi:dihydroorotase